jgi:hypothetical protein
MWNECLLALMALGVSACGQEVMRPKNPSRCLRVWYDAGGRRVVVPGKEVARLSETRVRVKQATGKLVDITSTNIAIEEGSCYISPFE